MFRLAIGMWVAGVAAVNGAVDERGAGVTPLRVTLCHGSLPRAMADETAVEATAVLRPAGIVLDVRVPTDFGCDRVDGSPRHVIVRVDVSRPLRQGPPKRPVASIQFIDGRPVPLITLSLGAARVLMEAHADTRVMLARVTQRVADRWTGRMLGRALAHEIGHYVLRSPHHSRTGLMRASHSVEAFVRPERSAFRVSVSERLEFLAALSPHPVAESATARR